jgi:aminoacrylate hydrolase
MAEGSTQIDVATPDGARLRVLVDGAGPDLLLVSGLGGAAAFWNAATGRLSRHHRVIRLDQRGIGASTRGTAPCTIDQLARDCVTVLEATGSDRAVMVGHSTGGCIGMALARIAPERLAGLVLSATWARPNRHMQALFGARRALVDHDPLSYAAMACLMTYPPEWLEANWHVYDAAMARAALSAEAVNVVRERIDALLAFDGSALLRDLRLPCLILGAQDDLIVPAYLQAELASALPHASRVMFGSGGHFFPHTVEDRFVDALDVFMSQTA